MTTAAPMTGWEPDTPTNDTLLRTYLFHWAAYCDAYAEAGGGRTHRSSRVACADLGRPAGYFNSATLLQPSGADAGDVLDEVEEFFGPGHGEVLLWSAWPTSDLARRGWRLEGHPPVLARPPAAILPAPASPPVDVRRVEDATGLADWEHVAIEAYPMRDLVGARPGALAHPTLLDDDRLGFWVGYDGGRAVSIGTLFVDGGVASFALAATRPEARRRGHWRAHAAARLDAVPDLWTTGVFSDDSRPGAEQIGFVPLQRLTLWSRPRP